MNIAYHTGIKEQSADVLLRFKTSSENNTPWDDEVFVLTKSLGKFSCA